MTKFVYFISDLHLACDEPHLTQLFKYFLQHEALQSDALYILGDFFAAWLGDDDRAAFNQEIMLVLRDISKKGLPIYLMPGNRDFLLGQDFSAAAGITLLTDPTLITLYGKKILLMHGDSLCTLDHKHQIFRRFAHNRSCQKIFLSVPLSWRYFMAKQMRNFSRRRGQTLPATVMDVVQEEVVQVMRKYNTDLLIHGHTHRPQIHSLETGNRIVLGAWHKLGNGLKYDENGQYALIDLGA